MSEKKIPSLDHLRALALRSAADSSAKIAELAGTVVGALEELEGKIGGGVYVAREKPDGLKPGDIWLKEVEE